MDVVLNYFRTLPRRQVVRPWALAVPVLVLLVALPLLRPLRSPDNISANELTRLATIQTMAEEHRQEIESSPFYALLRQRDYYQPPETVKLGRHVYSDKAPVLQLLLAGIYLVILKFRISFDNNPAVVTYL